MANISKIFSDSFNGNASSKVDTIKTEADAGSVSTSRTTQTVTALIQLLTDRYGSTGRPTLSTDGLWPGKWLTDRY